MDTRVTCHNSCHFCAKNFDKAQRLKPPARQHVLYMYKRPTSHSTVITPCFWTQQRQLWPTVFPRTTPLSVQSSACIWSRRLRRLVASVNFVTVSVICHCHAQPSSVRSHQQAPPRYLFNAVSAKSQTTSHLDWRWMSVDDSPSTDTLFFTLQCWRQLLCNYVTLICGRPPTMLPSLWFINNPALTAFIVIQFLGRQTSFLLFVHITYRLTVSGPVYWIRLLSL